MGRRSGRIRRRVPTPRDVPSIDQSANRRRRFRVRSHSCGPQPNSATGVTELRSGHAAGWEGDQDASGAGSRRPAMSRRSTSQPIARAASVCVLTPADLNPIPPQARQNYAPDTQQDGKAIRTYPAPGPNAPRCPADRPVSRSPTPIPCAFSSHLSTSSPNSATSVAELRSGQRTAGEGDQEGSPVLPRRPIDRRRSASRRIDRLCALRSVHHQGVDREGESSNSCWTIAIRDSVRNAFASRRRLSSAFLPQL
jgi:hypothetical protein